MDCIILNLAGATSQLAFGVSALVLVGGIVAYRIHKSKTKKLQKTEDPNEIGDWDDLLTEEDNNDAVVVDSESDNDEVTEAETSSLPFVVVDGLLSVERSEVLKPVYARKFVYKERLSWVQRSPYHSSLTIDELVGIYRKLAYKEQLSDSEKSEYNIVGSMLAKKSVFLTQKGYDFVREEDKIE